MPPPGRPPTSNMRKPAPPGFNPGPPPMIPKSHPKPPDDKHKDVSPNKTNVFQANYPDPNTQPDKFAPPPQPILPGIFYYDLDHPRTPKPWLNQKDDITDYFNYGFTEELWKEYAKKVKRGAQGVPNDKLAHAIKENSNKLKFYKNDA